MTNKQKPFMMISYDFSVYDIERDDWSGGNIVDALKEPSKYEIKLECVCEWDCIDVLYIDTTATALPERMEEGRKIPKRVHAQFLAYVNQARA